ncbi:PAS domain S-box-containing protein [Georgenia soli]|uniref:PAS domain S-box-containing protein n=1 Tax=Georgenia soli TaxID=638953 RepID=A0A2A9EJ22_9MICO|nr:ANTAR domain-containing protein [Georgenia soli]PFG39077.1 PAS domain S-box-containing protein [Georgenia soli]
MVEHSQAGGPADAFDDQLDALEKQIEAVRGALSRADSDALLADLQSAHEELRVADEEIRMQRAEVARLLESVHTRRWQHERLIQVLPVAVVVSDADGLIRSGNAAAAELLHVRAESLPGRPLVSFVLAEDRPKLRRRLATAVREHAPFRQVVALVPRGGEGASTELVASVSYDAVTDVTEVTWVLLRSGAREEYGLPAVLRPPAAAALVEMSKLPLHRIGRAASVARLAEICAQALRPDAGVSVTVGTPREPQLVATTSKAAQVVDGAQMVAMEGPGFDAWDNRRAVQVADLLGHSGWRRLTDLASGSGVRSVLALPITAGNDPVGVLALYSTELNGFDGGLRDVAELLVAAMAAVLHEIELKAELEDTARTLSQALESRATIEQAKGVIMAQAGVDADEAFARLVKRSRDSNVKLRVLAARIVQEAAGRRAGRTATEG